MIDIRDREQTEILMFTDSDFAGDRENRKSTSGWAIFASAGRSSLLLDYGSKSQSFVARSTAEAELAAGNFAIAMHGLAAQVSLSLLLGKEIYLCVKMDSQAAILAIGAAQSIAMRYLPKTQGVSLQWLSSVFELAECRLEKVDSVDNAADGFTKALERVKFEAFRKMLGINKV